jgi:lysozyme
MIRKLAALMIVLSLLAGLGWLGVSRWTPNRETYPVQGIDISGVHGEIDWNAVHSAEVDFAYAKASEGADLRDNRFASNWAGAAEAGMKRGAYHVFSLCRTGREQATNFIAMVPREAEALPPAIELEFDNNCERRPSRDLLLAEIATFIQMVEAHSEKPIMIRMTRDFESRYRISEAIDRPLWLQRAGLKPNYGAHDWVMWQASRMRRIEGIDGVVDWNVVHPQ